MIPKSQRRKFTDIDVDEALDKFRHATQCDSDALSAIWEVSRQHAQAECHLVRQSASSGTLGVLPSVEGSRWLVTLKGEPSVRAIGARRQTNPWVTANGDDCSRPIPEQCDPLEMLGLDAKVPEDFVKGLLTRRAVNSESELDLLGVNVKSELWGHAARHDR